MLQKKTIPKAASEFNAYNKKLGMLAEPATMKEGHEKYIGTIFTNQQTGFDLTDQ